MTKTVFFDIDSQLDFMVPAGALYVPGAEERIPAVAQLNRYAAAHGIPVVSTTDAHAENDVEFKVWPHHCVQGTWGQHKVSATLLEKRAVVPNRPFDLSDAIGAQQIVVEKDQIDLFKTPNIGELLGRLNADAYIVYGVVTEICVWLALDGLLRTGKAVSVVQDAIQSLKDAECDRVMTETRSRGGRILNLSEVTV